MLEHIRPAVATLALMTLLTGVAYPLAVTAMAHLAFPDQAAGSLVRDETGQVRGSRLIAQAFDGDQWFQPRPSAGDYATVASAAACARLGPPVGTSGGCFFPEKRIRSKM